VALSGGRRFPSVNDETSLLLPCLNLEAFLWRFALCCGSIPSSKPASSRFAPSAAPRLLLAVTKVIFKKIAICSIRNRPFFPLDYNLSDKRYLWSADSLGRVGARIMKLLALFLAGLAAGVAVCWTHIGSLRATVKLYETYIHYRIDALSKDHRSDEKQVPASPHKYGPVASK
jgi:hypothetical protein